MQRNPSPLSFIVTSWLVIPVLLGLLLTSCTNEQPGDGATPSPQAPANPVVEEEHPNGQTAPGDEEDSPPAQLRLQLVAQGFNSPVHLTSAGDGSGRLFVVDRVGFIYVVTAQGRLLSEPLLDLRQQMVDLRDNYDERGLLGLAFHPNFAENGLFYVHYSAPLRAGAPTGWDHTGRIAQFKIAEPEGLAAEVHSEQVLLEIDQPQANHNGGALAFGPDGYLYVGLGDGGGANDTGPGHSPMGNGQDVNNLLGSILRLDVASPAEPPRDNPFAQGGGRPEIYAWGFRNPYRLSFDRGGERSLFVADVGQDLWEEVNLVVAPGNFGWPVKEGSHWFDRGDPHRIVTEGPATDSRGKPFIDPIIEYRHPGVTGGVTVSEAAAHEGSGQTTGQAAHVGDVAGISVIGGYVYRGSELKGRQGQYIFGDWSTEFRRGKGQIFTATATDNPEQPWVVEPALALDEFVLGFGQDEAGELYVLTTEKAGPVGESGRVYKIVAANTN